MPYYLLVNDDECEFVDPHTLGHGAKLGEQVFNEMSQVATWLMLTRWTDDKVRFVSDSSEEYERREDGYTNVTREVHSEFHAFFKSECRHS